MHSMNRYLITTLLLLIVTSNVFADVHAATHIIADPGECVLCASYGSPTAVLPASGVLLPPVTKNIQVADFYNAAEWASSIVCIHSRGPPLAL